MKIRFLKRKTAEEGDCGYLATTPGNSVSMATKGNFSTTRQICLNSSSRLEAHTSLQFIGTKDGILQKKTNQSRQFSLGYQRQFYEIFSDRLKSAEWSRHFDERLVLHHCFYSLLQFLCPNIPRMPSIFRVNKIKSNDISRKRSKSIE